MKKKVTTTDIAKMAGVSQATVSMILNKKYNVSFSRETIEKVEKAAEELGYHKSECRRARNLRVRSSSLSFARLSRIPTM